MKSLKIRGINYFFRDLYPEKADAILLVHGHPFDHTMWDYQLTTLENFRLVLPDLRGYGKTDHDFDRIYIEEHALDLAFLLDELRIERVHLIGLSMGGQIIVEFARLFPHRTRSLMICGSTPTAETKHSYAKRLALAERLLALGMEEYTRQDIQLYLHPSTSRKKGKVYDHLFDMMANTSARGAAASHRGRAERRDNFLYLSQLKVPTLIIGGDQDGFTPLAELEKVKKAIPGSRLVIIEKAGHMTNMEQPEAFNAAAAAFLNSDVAR